MNNEIKVTSQLLFKEEPLVINKPAVRVLGLNEAIVVQQIHYWLDINRKAKINFHDGRTWTYNTYENWVEKNFDFWSVPTLKRIFKNLFDKEILLKGNYNSRKYDRTLWVTINYEKLDELLMDFKEKNKENVEISTKCQNDTMSNFNIVSNWNDGKDQIDTLESVKVIPPIPKTTKEITKEISTTQSTKVDSVVEDKNIKLIENKTHLKAMSNNMKRKVSKWNYERLEKAIEKFISLEGIYFTMLEKIYKDDKNFVPKKKKDDIPKVKTRFHNINERFGDYEPKELERLLKESQKDKFKNISSEGVELIVSDSMKDLISNIYLNKIGVNKADFEYDYYLGQIRAGIDKKSNKELLELAKEYNIEFEIKNNEYIAKN